MSIFSTTDAEFFIASGPKNNPAEQTDKVRLMAGLSQIVKSTECRLICC